MISLMNVTASSPIALSERELLSVIGSEHAEVVYRLDRAHLVHGQHYTCAHGITVYNEAGLQVLVEKLEEVGCQVASHCLRVDLDQRRGAPSRTLIPAGRKSTEPYYRRGDLA